MAGKGRAIYGLTALRGGSLWGAVKRARHLTLQMVADKWIATDWQADGLAQHIIIDITAVRFNFGEC
ncbi:MAG: hypothetical protein NTV49_02130 [Kiritimatiellaeota bacterium]|nr:hypothetical protein [Kiritimatiellota bacterium]